MPDHEEDLAPDIADNHTLAGGMFLAVYFAIAIEAAARDEALPSPSEAWDMSGEADIASLLNNTKAVMGTVSKKSMTRFFAALADLITLHGAEMEMFIHKLTRPDEEQKVALILSRADAERLVEAMGVQV